LNGPQLTLDAQQSSLQTTVASSTCPPAALKFESQPANAFVGQTISSSPLNPLGSPVTVEVVDGLGNVVDSSASVSVSQQSGPPGATLGGMTTQTAAHGVATFGNLTLDKAGTYTLAANATGLTPAISGSFVESTQTQTVPCPGGACTTTLSSPPGTTPSSVTVTTTGSPGAGGTLNLSVDVGTKPVCATSSGAPYVGHDQNFYGTVYTPNAGTAQVAKTMKYTLFDTGGVQGIHLCFAAPYEFEVLGDTNAPPGTLPDGTPGFVGLLENCDPANDAVADPCQTTTTVPDSNVPTGVDTVITISIPAAELGDPAYYP
jgi:hypothetical protein